MKIKSLTKSISIIFMLSAMLSGCCLFGNEDTGNGGGNSNNQGCGGDSGGSLGETTYVRVTFDLGDRGSGITFLRGIPGSALTIDLPTRSGYNFDGWEPEISTTIPEKDTNYTAKWVLKDYTITYNLNGGANAEENPVIYNVETETITLANPTKEIDSVFAGWYTDETFSRKITTIEKGSVGNITLYACWGIKENFIYIDYSSVTDSNFYISDHEVTQTEYEKYCTLDCPSSSEFNYPAYNIKWFETLVYCNKRSIAEGLTPCYTIKNSTNPDEWGKIPVIIDDSTNDSNWNSWWDVTCDFTASGYRLPTVAEWEYAAKGGEDYKHAGSNDVREVSWHKCNSGNTAHPVAQKKANGYGLYDMSGNVWEWCWDSYKDSQRKLCGGSFMLDMCEKDCTLEAEDSIPISKPLLSLRSLYRADYFHGSVGFRVVRTAE